MIRFLLNVAINLVSAAVALLVAGWLIEGVRLQTAGFLVAVAVYTLALALLTPFVLNVARKYASVMVGGFGLVATLLALWVATLFPGGLEINGVTAWIAAPFAVWLISMLLVWFLGFLLLKRWWDRRQKARAAAA